MSLPFRSLVAIALFLAASAPSRALQPEDLSRILDAPDLAFTLQVNDAQLTEDASVFATGASSLAVRPVIEANEQRPTINFSITFPAAGPGRFTCRARVSGANLGLFNVDGVGAFEQLASDWQPETWYKLSFPINASRQEVAFAMWPFLENANAVFHFDDFRYESGVILTVEDRPSLGAIAFSPQKDLYAVGETVTVSITPTHPDVIPSITEIDREIGWTTERPASFQIRPESHLQFIASYRQNLDFGSFRGEATLVDSRIDPDAPEGFAFSRLVLRDVPAKSLLAFKIAPDYRSTVTIEDSGHVHRRDVWQTADDDEPLAFVPQRIEFENASDSLTFETNSNGWLPRPAIIRDLRLLADKQVVAETSGRGSVAVSYQPGPNGAVRARLLATPADGWSFLRWQDLATSTEPALDLLIDRPRAITAQFAQTFDFGPSRWAFLHDGSLRIDQTTDGRGIRIEADALPTQVGYEISVHRAGPLSAQAYLYAADGKTLASTSNLFSPPSIVQTPPQTVSGVLWLYDAPVAEIRDIVVAGGSSYDDTTLTLHAPADAVTVSQDLDRIPLDQTITLSIADAYRDRFLAWTGDLYSENPDLSLTATGSMNIAALFQQAWTTNAGRSLVNRGTHLLPSPDSLDNLAFPLDELAPGAWTELVIEKAPEVVVGLAFDPSSDYLEFSAFVGDRELTGGEKWFRRGVWYLQSLYPSDQPLRLRFTNDSDSPKRFAISQLAFLSDSRNWWPDWPVGVPGLGGGSVAIDSEERYHQLGARVALAATPISGFVFAGWGATSPAPDANGILTIPQDGRVRLVPNFAPDNAPTGLTFLPGESHGWNFGGADPLRLTAKDFLQADQTLVLALQIDGPGVLAFSPSFSSFQSEPLTIELLVNGAPTPLDNYNVTSFPHDQEALLPIGSNFVELRVALSDKARQSGDIVSNLALTDFTFLPGFAVTYSSDFPHLPKVSPQTFPSVYQAGASVTISPDFVSGETFGSWTGDLAEFATASVTLKLNQHIIANPKPSTASKSGVLSARISETAIFTASSPTANQLDYLLAYQGGPTELVFEVPAMTELFLEIFEANGPIEARVNGVLTYQGDPGELSLAFPVKPTAQRVELSIQLDRHQTGWASVIATASQRFSLTGDFGAAQEFVYPDPRKDDYAPGEKVAVKLGNGVDSRHVFQDVVAAYPTLNRVEWLDAEGKKSFEVEMASHIVLLGKVGPPATRSLGQVVAGPGLALANAAARSPDNRPTQRAYFDGSSDAPFLRIATQGARHIDFWIQAPPQLDLVFSDLEVDGFPFFIEGNGLWQKASLAVPTGQKYISAFLLSDSSAAESLHISSVNTATGYGIQYLITGNADLSISPANGAASPSTSLSLTLYPASGYHLEAWNDIEGKPLQRSLAPNQAAFLRPVVAKNPVYLPVGSLSFRLQDAELLPDNAGARLANDGASLSATVTGPGRLLYQANSFGSGYLTLLVDGETYDPDDFFHTHLRPDVPNLPIPAGQHEVVFRFNKFSPTAQANIDLTHLSFEKGSYLLPNPFPQNGSIQVSPNQLFFPLGTNATIAAQPNLEYVFDSWTDNLRNAPKRSTYTFSPVDHTRFDAAFRRQASYQKDGATWRVASDPQNPQLSHLSTTVNGPGYVRISYHIAQDLNFLARLDQRAAQPIHHGYHAFLPIPAGAHHLWLQADSSSSFFQSGVDFLPGFLFLLTGETGALRISPIQDRYLPGSEITVALDPEGRGPTDLRYAVGDRILAPQQSSAFTLDRHFILPVRRLQPFPGTDFLTDAAPNAIQATQESDGPRFDLVSLAHEPVSLHRQIVGPAALSFQLKQIRDWEVILFVDDQPALTFHASAQPSLLVPNGSHDLRWQFRSLSTAPVDRSPALSHIQISPFALSPYQQWLAASIPAHRFVAGLGLAPEQDLDGDGWSNALERTRSTPPHRFDFSQQIVLPRSGLRELRFELPNGIDPASLFLLAYHPSLPVPAWERYALPSLDYRLAPADESTRQALAIPVDGPLANALLFCLEANPSAP